MDSIVDRGSNFWFDLEFKRAVNEVVARGAEPLCDLKGMRALVVDDNRTNRKSYHLLDAWGMRSDGAVDGAEALRLLGDARQGDDPYVVALLDGIMPGMSGLDLALAIRNESRLRDTHLILLTSVMFRGDQYKKARQLRACHLHKPVRKAVLYKCLCKLLGEGGLRSSAIEGKKQPGRVAALAFPRCPRSSRRGQPGQSEGDENDVGFNGLYGGYRRQRPGSDRSTRPANPAMSC